MFGNVSHNPSEIHARGRSGFRQRRQDTEAEAEAAQIQVHSAAAHLSVTGAAEEGRQRQYAELRERRQDDRVRESLRLVLVLVFRCFDSTAFPRSGVQWPELLAGHGRQLLF